MGASRNQESTRQEKDGVVYYDRGILTGKDGRRYQRYAIHTHFVQPARIKPSLSAAMCCRCISRATACPSPRR